MAGPHVELSGAHALEGSTRGLFPFLHLRRASLWHGVHGGVDHHLARLDGQIGNSRGNSCRASPPEPPTRLGLLATVGEEEEGEGGGRRGSDPKARFAFTGALAPRRLLMGVGAPRRAKGSGAVHQNADEDSFTKPRHRLRQACDDSTADPK